MKICGLHSKVRINGIQGVITHIGNVRKVGEIGYENVPFLEVKTDRTREIIEIRNIHEIVPT